MKAAMDILIENIKTLCGDKTLYWVSKKSGVTQATLSRLMNKQLTPSLRTVEQIANALQVTPAQILTDKAEPTIPTDILENLEGSSPTVYEAVRGILKALKKEKATKKKASR